MRMSTFFVTAIFALTAFSSTSTVLSQSNLNSCGLTGNTCCAAKICVTILNADAIGISIDPVTRQCCAPGLNAISTGVSCTCQDATGGGQLSPIINPTSNPNPNYYPPTPTARPTSPPPADSADVNSCPNIPCPAAGNTFSEYWYSNLGTAFPNLNIPNNLPQNLPNALNVCPQGTYPRIVAAQANSTTLQHDQTNTTIQCVNNRPNGAPCGSSDGLIGYSAIGAPDVYDGYVTYPPNYQLFAYKSTGFSTLRYGCGSGSFCNMSTSLTQPTKVYGVCTGFYQNVPRPQIVSSDPFSLNRVTCATFADCAGGKQCVNNICVNVFDRYGPCSLPGRTPTDGDYSCPPDQYCALNSNSVPQCQDSTRSGGYCTSDAQCSTGLCLSTTVPPGPIRTCQDPDWSFVGQSCNTNQLNPNTLGNGFRVMDAGNGTSPPPSPTVPPTVANINCGELGWCTCTMGSSNNHGVCVKRDMGQYNSWLFKNGKTPVTGDQWNQEIESTRRVTCFSQFTSKQYVEANHSSNLSSSLAQTLILAVASFLAMFKF